jgi:membrane protein YqaA with SNARE-associated domain
MSRANPISVSVKWETIGRVFAFLAAIGITLGIIFGRDLLTNLPIHGYFANFLVSLISSATVIIPAPSFALVLLTGGVLNPIGVGIAAGVGAALGELTGYLAGWSGQKIWHQRSLYQKVQRVMERYGLLIIFVMAFVPNPIFDIGGMIAGAMRIPVWQFLLVCCLGKSLRFVLLALGVDYIS